MRALILTVAGVGLAFAAGVRTQPARPPIDPAAWGSDHVGRPLPDFVHGDECLFCHRDTIGTTWQENAHAATVRHREDAPDLGAIVSRQPRLGGVAKEIEFFLGSRHRVRFLKRAGYGKFAMLAAQAAISDDGQPGTTNAARDAATRQPGQRAAAPVRVAERQVRAESWQALENSSWDNDTFANRCAGCHATAVDPRTKTFAAFGLDCYTCHGSVTLDHTGDTTLVLWSTKRRNETGFLAVQTMMSICAQCHLREGRSRSSGLPYPNSFVAGDNLFRDFEADFAKAGDAALNPGDRHVYRNVRDVVARGDGTLTCTSCHRVHAGSSNKHRLIPRGPICFDCHRERDEKDGKLATLTYRVGSALCEYDGAPMSGR